MRERIGYIDMIEAKLREHDVAHTTAGAGRARDFRCQCSLEKQAKLLCGLDPGPRHKSRPATLHGVAHGRHDSCSMPAMSRFSRGLTRSQR